MCRLPLVLLLSSFVFSSFQAIGQNIFKNNDARLVIGVETSLPINGKTYTNKPIGGLIIEKPLGQFSVGMSLSQVGTSDFAGYKKGGLHSVQRMEQGDRDIQALDIHSRSQSNNSMGLEQYEYTSYTFEAEHLILGAELKYRLPCNCFFVYANIKQGYQLSKTVIEEDIISTEELSYHEVNDSNISKGIGLGVNMPFSKQLRAVLKFGKEFSKGLFISEEGNAKSINSFNISAGLQYGFR